MSRMYIDAITLLKNRPTPPDSLDTKGIEGFRCCLRMYNAQIEKQIANRDTDMVKVMHGHWILEREPNGQPYCFHCSVCDDEFRRIDIKVQTPYCPHCGAKMDGERRTNNE